MENPIVRNISKRMMTGGTPMTMETSILLQNPDANDSLHPLMTSAIWGDEARLEARWMPPGGPSTPIPCIMLHPRSQVQFSFKFDSCDSTVIQLWFYYILLMLHPHSFHLHPISSDIRRFSQCLRSPARTQRRKSSAEYSVAGQRLKTLASDRCATDMTWCGYFMKGRCHDIWQNLANVRWSQHVFACVLL